jgi:maltose alpha-D-glucosyltransferase/alpha-amylase
MLASQRWFGEKGAPIRSATLRDAIPLQLPGLRPYMVGRADVSTDAGTTTWQIFFEAGDTTYADALADPTFRRALARSFEHDARFQRGGAAWVVRREVDTLPPLDADVALGSAQQSNSSLIVGDTAILKLYRRLQPGMQPDLEVTRFLTVERGFHNVPALIGSIAFEDGGATTVAGQLQEFARGARDCWAIAVDTAGGAPLDARELGAVTRRMHEELASGAPGTAFESRAAGRAEVDRWARGAAATVSRAMQTLERSLRGSRLPADLHDAARAALARGPEVEAATHRLAAGAAGDAGAIARGHGDYHLGQVLRDTTGRLLIIDFEGEPSRPIAERREPTSPLRDVAGMLRSFAYAAAVRGGHTHDMAAWEREQRDAFLGGYLGGGSAVDSGGPALLPRATANLERLVALFEWEKLYYELAYELDHRPGWSWIPLRGIAGIAT